ncbi:MAG: proline--tRNA ligase [Alphaproteobacteria bacterium]|nr:proline--tRNA ligase [Alphaproteobacteria bacterium]
MKISNYFLPILKEDPVNAEVISHKLMLRAGMIKQQNSGIYSWLPFGLKVLRNIENIIREEMNKSGANEVLMPCIQSADLWKESGRYDDYGKEMLKIKDRHDNDLLFGPTAEELISDIVRSNINSYKDFPKTFYQINWKFRDEIRPRFGVMRGREFFMKDAYSFDLDKESSVKTYDEVLRTYINIFKKIGLKSIPIRADTGPIGGELSHEFHVIADTGESDIFYDIEIENELSKEKPDVEKIRKLYAMADDMHQDSNCSVSQDKLKKHKSIEVGHIFNYGSKYSESMGVFFMNNEGKKSFFYGGCYGIGVSRLVAAVIECFHDKKGIIWPKSITPFHVSILNLHTKDETSVNISNNIYGALLDKGLDVLYDDSSLGAGAKFAKHELLGIPYQIVSSSRLAVDKKVEVRCRETDKVEVLDIDRAVDFLIKIYKEK